MTERGQEWWNFAWDVLHFVEDVTVAAYGDKPDDQVTAWTPEDCVRQIGKYVARFGKNQRGEEDQERDMYKIAHYCAIALAKMREEQKA